MGKQQLRNYKQSAGSSGSGGVSNGGSGKQGGQAKISHHLSAKVMNSSKDGNNGKSKHHHVIMAESKLAAKSQRKEKKAPEYVRDFHKLKAKIAIWHNFFEDDPTVEAERDDVWDTLDALQSELCHKYAWAVHDDRALNIVSHFSPLIEIGCGRGLWAKLLAEEKKADIVAFDKFVELDDCWTDIVARGGPEQLSENSVARGRALFLCYPDEMESMATECLDQFTGDYIIHIGELMVTGGTLCGAPTSPWGRTSSAEFQVRCKYVPL
jgi:hypothetical protein